MVQGILLEAAAVNYDEFEVFIASINQTWIGVAGRARRAGGFSTGRNTSFLRREESGDGEGRGGEAIPSHVDVY